MTESGRRIGVFGGTFDPIHLGHLIIASELWYALSLERVLFVPAGRPPHKANRAISDDETRLAMLRLALANAPQFDVCTVDLDRAGPSYTSELLALLAEREPHATLVFLMGEDSLRDLPNWHEPDRIVTLAEVGVASRPAIDYDLETVFRAIPRARGRVHVVPVPLIDISSAMVRARVASGRPFEYLVSAAVAAFIRSNELYRS